MKTESARKLRLRAEEELRQPALLASKPHSPEEAVRNYHELQVFKVELEMQNEELLRTQGELTEALSKTNEQLRSLGLQQEMMFIASPLGMVLLVDRISIKLNQRLCEMTGYDMDELIGQKSSIIYRSQEDYEQFGAYAYPILAAGKICYGESVFRKKDGTCIDVSLIGGRYDVNDIAGGIIWIVDDITQRKKDEAVARMAAEALRESEEKYRVLVESVSEIIVVIQDGVACMVNPTAISVTGYSEEELSTTPFPAFIHPDDRDRVVERHWARLRGEEPLGRYYEFRLVTKDARVIWVVNCASIINWEGRPATLSILTNISEQKNLQDKLEQALDAERNARTEQGRFIAMFSHEYRTPLAIIRGNIDLIELKESSKTGDYAAELATMKRAVSRLVELMDISFAKSRIIDYQTKGDVRAIKAVSFMEALLEYIRTIRPAHEFIYEKQLDVSVTFNGEAEYLKTALVNLLDNAVKYSTPNTPITINCRTESAELVISIRNYGFGLTPAEEEWLFEKYRRGSGSRNTGGAGLGLWLVRDIITQHGGSITLKGVKSEVTATVRLPLA